VLIDHVLGGKYRITELIGQGGMGTVFEAVHTGTGARVAIKLIVSSDIKEEVFVRFQREARAAGSIDSQHIVRVFDMGVDDRSGSPFMVMERLVGEDLSQMMRRIGPMPPEICARITAQAAVGVGKAHEVGVVHRDIKPANLFLHDSDSGDVVLKILDFGIAKVRIDMMQRAEEGGLTRTGSMLGSPHYMSPEQAQGLKTIDHRTDVWSLGVVLYKMLTGHTPYAHVQTLGQVILAICSQPVRPVQELAPWVPPELAMVVQRALQQDPAHRFQSAYEMYSALLPLTGGTLGFRRAFVGQLTPEQRARVAQPLAQLVEPSTHGSFTESALVHTQGAPKRRGRGGVVIAIATGAAVALAAVGGTAVWLKRSRMQQTAAAAAQTAAPASPTVTTPPTDAPPTPAATLTRTVTVHVPEGAAVIVDGSPAEVASGAILLTGPLGSVHTVEVKSESGTSQTSAVAITEKGAVPDAVIPAAAPTATAVAAASPKPGPAPRATGKPTTARPTTTTPPSSGGLNATTSFE
jgi:eukaryotic-like serine/threonine-protein kinase